jgi:hypothetical protein
MESCHYNKASLVFLMTILLTFFTLELYAQNKSFKVFNAWRYRNTPDLTRFGFSNINVVYENDLLSFDKDNPKDRGRQFMDVNKVVTIAKKALTNSDIPVVLDIESWSLDSDFRNVSLTKYLNVLKLFKNINSVSKVGYFGFPLGSPNPRYYFKDTRQQLMFSRIWNDKKIFQHVAMYSDIFYPDFYASNPDMIAWEAIVRAKIARIRNTRKNAKIYAFIWPQYFTPDGIFRFTDIKTWRFELETMYKYVDGVVIWGHPKGPDGKTVYFNPNMPWYQETLKFISYHNLNKTN